MKMKILYAFLLVAIILPWNISARTQKHSFAIVVDRESYKQVKNDIDLYAKAIQRQDLNTHIIVDEWQNADSIRKRLSELYH